MQPDSVSDQQENSRCNSNIEIYLILSFVFSFIFFEIGALQYFTLLYQKLNRQNYNISDMRVLISFIAIQFISYQINIEFINIYDRKQIKTRWYVTWNLILFVIFKSAINIASGSSFFFRVFDFCCACYMFNLYMFPVRNTQPNNTQSNNTQPSIHVLVFGDMYFCFSILCFWFSVLGLVFKYKYQVCFENFTFSFWIVTIAYIVSFSYATFFNKNLDTLINDFAFIKRSHFVFTHSRYIFGVIFFIYLLIHYWRNSMFSNRTILFNDCFLILMLFRVLVTIVSLFSSVCFTLKNRGVDKWKSFIHKQTEKHRVDYELNVQQGGNKRSSGVDNTYKKIN